MKVLEICSKAAYRQKIDDANSYCENQFKLGNLPSCNKLQEYLEHPVLDKGLIDLSKSWVVPIWISSGVITQEDVDNTADVDIESWFKEGSWIYSDCQYRFFIPDEKATTDLKQLTLYALLKEGTREEIKKFRKEGGYDFYVDYFEPGHRELLEVNQITIEENQAV